MRKVTLFCLALVMLVAVNAMGQAPGVKVYGFFDFEAEVSNKDAAGRIWTFDQHHLNVIAIYRVDRHLRVFTELEWEHGPAISADEITGHVYLARAYLDYKYTDALQLRLGIFISPFGIYNERHDATPTFISTKLPHTVYGKHELSAGNTGRLFAKIATGVQVLGNVFVGRWEGKYQLYLSNGRGTDPSAQDDNPNKGFGARLVITPPVANLRLGVSYYADRNGKDGHTRQSALGFDAELDYAGFHMESELLLSRLEQVDERGKPNDSFRNIRGGYVLIAYTVFDMLTPFARYEFETHDLALAGHDEDIITVGLNLAVTDKVYLKNEIHIYNTILTEEPRFEMWVSSVAVAF